jgi:hypothetical protein
MGRGAVIFLTLARAFALACERSRSRAAVAVALRAIQHDLFARSESCFAQRSGYRNAITMEFPSGRARICP